MTIEQRDIDREAARLYLRFSNYHRVAAEMQCSVSTAYDRVQRALWAEPDHDVATAKKLALARLGDQAVIAQEVAEGHHIAHSNGRVIYLDDQPVRDLTPNLQALDRLARIEDQRNKLLGLYAPSTVRVEVVPSEVIEALIRENERIIAAAERELGVETVPPGSAIDVPLQHAPARTSVPGGSNEDPAV